MRRRPCGHVFFFVAVSVSVGLCGCAIARSTASAKGTAAATAFVRKVDIHQAPEMKELAEHARQFGNEMYPKVLALLVDDNSTLPQATASDERSTGGGPRNERQTAEGRFSILRLHSIF